MRCGAWRVGEYEEEVKNVGGAGEGARAII